VSDQLKQDALQYHRQEPAGKLAIAATKPMATQADLALAYSPGVAYACEEIAEKPVTAYEYTAKGNLVGVVTNGTAVLGLGAIGALASKPVMEGKAVLFKKFANVDCFDIEIDELDPHKLIETVARLEPTFGGINLEDIKAPDCVIVERAVREKMNIPVFHDDQHGTAIVVAAAVVNGLKVVNKEFADVKLVASGAGAASISCLNLLVSLGLPKENILVVDRKGVISTKRMAELDEFKAAFARDTDAVTLDDAMEGADIFLGLSSGGLLKAPTIMKMAKDPLILALANPNPEILPEDARAVRPDAILATGRSDYPNQVNNVLCFPFIFRGALDVAATTINEPMKIAVVNAIAELARQDASDIVRNAYVGESLKFGPEYLIPKPFDPRLISIVAPAVAKAAMETGVATRPIQDLKKYAEKLNEYVFQTGMLMRPVFEKARANPKRVVYAEGHRERILMAARQVIDEGIAEPILIGRRDLIESQIEDLGIDLVIGRDFKLIDPLDAETIKPYAREYHRIMARRGINAGEALEAVQASQTALASLVLEAGDADAMICGRQGRFRSHLRQVHTIIGRADGVKELSTVAAIIHNKGNFFICDTHVNANPSAEEIAESTLLAAEEVRRFGLEPRVALLSFSNFGTNNRESPRKMRQALEIIRSRAPDLNVDGEMHADSALDPSRRHEVFPDSTLTGRANLLVMPNLDAANIVYNMVRSLGTGLAIGPMLLGTRKPAHVVTQSVSVRGLVNMTAVAVNRAQEAE
jgi:malate dehydrogenase (oxaloacetate-decarboxylating)(NADP+)